ncbi:uncharacterized protein zgc:113184 isoform X2 [Cyclopterus lumpus]|uniref:Uncharacterized protein n=1 Tax=Cyclopterus lumpus TaxID=8103 RepID=A0A8C2XLD5_CYCLU|nr:uncharacterized protein zgc:113184 isoform X2 [Cyclopterus lumpus]
MEEAYSELYQQFLQLRALCLRQAALLHQLTTALQKRQGDAVPNGELIDMMSIPVQCTQELAVSLHGMEDGPLEQMVTPLLSWDFMGWQGASSSVSNHPGHTNHHSRDRTKHTVGMPSTDSPSLPRDLLNPSDELLMSDVVLQSHVCEFCQAVFPGDAATRGEFLRHLYTHVT